MKKLANAIMLFNFILAAVLLLPSCKFLDRPAEYGVIMKIEKVNAFDIVVYSCVKWRNGATTPLQMCDTKQECNQYCDKARGAIGGGGT